MENAQRVNTITDHGCFGCGEGNAIGLKLAFYRANDGVVGEFTPGVEHEGYTKMIHGGIVSTVLDEAMSWAVIDSGHLAVTARMSVNFRQPIPSQQPLDITASITRDRGRAVETKGEIRSRSGELLASSTALFVRVSDEQQREWEATYMPTTES